MTIEEINSLERDAFVERLGWIFEHSPWVAGRSFAARPFDSVDALHAAMIAQVERASPEEQLELLRAHPDLGSRRPMSAVSENEQSGAGLNRLATAELASLRELNAAYREKFGFPFLYAVKGSTSGDILQTLTARLPNSPDEEFRTALQQVYRIARFRLEEAVD